MNLKRAILLEYRRVHDAAPGAPYLHARDALPERLGQIVRVRGGAR